MIRRASLLTLLGFLAGSGRGEVGSRACASCHSEIYRQYTQTPMALSSGVPGAGLVREKLHFAEFKTSPGEAFYRVSAENNHLLFSVRVGDLQASRPLDFFIGSGAVGRSYATLVDGFLFQAPVSYYSGAGKWNVSPGYEKSPDVNLLRAVEPACLRCHASRLQHDAGTVNGYANPPFLEGGVSCERCHGAGEQHIAHIREGKSGKDSSIINPAKLEMDRRDSVCAQCHLSGAVEIAREGRDRSFRPGDKMADFVSIFVWDNKSANMPVISHFEKMEQSACRRGAPDKLWCGSCHDPHSQPAETAKSAYYRDRCYRCHSDASCSAPKQQRAAQQNNCVECHMPKQQTAEVRHAVFTDHSIPRVPRSTSSHLSNAEAELVPFPGMKAGEREKALAYGDIALRDNNRDWGMRALELLRKLIIADPNDIGVALQFAHLHERVSDEKSACEIYARIFGKQGVSNAALANWGACLAKEGKLAEAIPLWADILRRNPGLESVRLNLAVAQFKSGNVDEAKQTLQQALHFNPACRRAHELLQVISASKSARAK